MRCAPVWSRDTLQLVSFVHSGSPTLFRCNRLSLLHKRGERARLTPKPPSWRMLVSLRRHIAHYRQGSTLTSPLEASRQASSSRVPARALGPRRKKPNKALSRSATRPYPAWWDESLLALPGFASAAASHPQNPDRRALHARPPACACGPPRSQPSPSS